MVTGGGSGLGEATVRRLHAAGARVAIVDLAADKGQTVAAELEEDALFVAADVSSEAEAQRAVAQARDHFGALHGLVNCAGVAPAARVLGKSGLHSLESFSRCIAINLIGSFNMLRLVAAVMAEQTPDAATTERGVIVNTASIAAYEGQIGQAAYAASKAGVVGMTLPIARELARLGIRVVTIAPGLFETPMLGAMTPEVTAALTRSTLFPQRLGKPDEYAALVQHIVENEMLNGVTIRLDGAVRLAAK
jgi:NAD(P)-dependent dehydrogenase (short-subunit alcohol dehydrogenase family)